MGDAWLVCAWCGEQLAAPAELPTGAELGDGRYRVLGVIGRGGFGITYEAGDARLRRRVAIKELFPQVAVRHGSMVLKGFLMNFLNPFVLFLWIGAISLASNKLDHEPSRIIAFFAATLSTILGTDILKSLGAGKIKSYINESTIHKVNMIAGIILLISGIVLIVRVLVEKPWEH